MNNNITKSGIDLNSDIEFKNVDELIAGCDLAEVTFALNDKGRLCRLVTLYSGKDFLTDYVVAGQGETMVSQHDISMFRTVSYSIKDSAVRTGIKHYTVIMKDVPGFVPVLFTHDCRTQTPKYGL